MITGSIEFIGTATVLVRCAGFTILTDPNFLHRGDHAHIGYGLTAKRLTNPSRELESLPALDFVILSHMHEDHFDRYVQRNLSKDTPVLAPGDAIRRLRRLGFARARGLERWEAVRVDKAEASVTIAAMPGEHGPGLVSRALPTVMGSMLDFRDLTGSLRLYISGDTLAYAGLAEIPKRYPGVDIALLHLGGTRVLGVMVTMDGRAGVRLMRIVAPRIAIPIHFDDYDRFRSPLSDFTREVQCAGLAGSVRYLARGETYEFETP